MKLRRRLRYIWRIARWETSHTSTSIDRRTLATGLGILVIVGLIATVGLATGLGGVSPSQDIYRVGVDSDSDYYPVVESHTALAAHEPDEAKLEAGEIDALVIDSGQQAAQTQDGELELTAGESGEIELESVSRLTVLHTPTEKGTAAVSTFRIAVEQYNDRLMALEENQTAAYPVIVQLQYLPQQALDGQFETDPAVDDVEDVDDDIDEDADDDEAVDDDEADVPVDADQDGEDDEAVDDDEVDGAGPELADEEASLADRLFGTGAASGSPAEISPPFPFSSLLLAFVFLIPMNFIIQAYGGSILNERINRRGELLLVAPLSRVDIVAGKTLPYLAVATAAITAISLAVGGGLLSVLAVVPIALAFLTATFVGAMFARSFKELTFVTVTISVLLTTYVFVPAIFTNVTPIALISPLTLVVMDLQGEAIGIGAYVFSTAPFYLGSAILFVLGLGVYREEDMFTQKPVPLKFLDALDSRLYGPKSVAVVSGLMIPFVFVAELLAIAVLFVLPIEVSIPIILVVIAAIEEVAKSIHVYAGFESDRFDRSGRTAVMLGALSGVGFFVAEKFTAISQLVGLPELALGQAVLAPAGVTPTATLALLAAPLVLHVVTAGISALGAKRNLRWYLIALVVATLVHAGYNFAVVSFYG